MLRNMDTSRYSVGELMVFCMDNFECAGDIILILKESINEAI